MADIEIRLLGPLEALRDGQTVVLGGAKQRGALALLALNAGRVVSADSLIEALWDEHPPATAATALQGHVSRLRRLLGAEEIVTRSPGYVLETERGATDLSRFEDLVERSGGEAAAVRAATLREALALWRGPAIADLAGERGLAEEARRLDELRLSAREELFDVELALGRHVELVPQLERFSREEPYRERPVGQLMLSLYRAGRQADALDLYRRFRRRLSETLGLEPGAPLRELERRMLAHDPALAPPAVTASDEPPGTGRLPLTAVAIAYSAVAVGQADPDTEAFAQVAARTREAIRLALERHGASVRRGVGSRLVGLFGDPAPHEDDALRGLLAARAGLAAVDAAAGEVERRFGIRLAARSGIASGESFGGESPAVDLALELCAGAMPGEIAIDDTTRAAARGREFRLDRPLVGRDAERQQLRAAFVRAVGGQGGVGMTLTGPAGIGKSRLATDLLGSLGVDTRVAIARCLSYGDGIALWPAVELVRAAAGLTPGVSEGAARTRLGSLVGTGDHSAGAVDQLLALLGLSDDGVPDEELPWAVRRLFEGLAARQPVVVYVDDLHWAAPPMIDVLDQLAHADGRVFVLATARTPSPVAIGETVELGPLDPAACGEVVAGLLGAERIAHEVLSPLVRASDGNPFFLEELVRDLRAAGRLREEDGGWALERAVQTSGGSSLPRSIQTLLADRLAQLPGAQREVLMCASVMGRSFARVALVQLLEAEAAESLEALVEAQLLQPTTAEDVDFEFRHLLIRDAAYAILPLERRAELHERLAGWIDDAHVTAPLVREGVALYHLDQAYRSLAALAPGDQRLVDRAGPLAARTAQLGRVLLGRGDVTAAVALLGRARELDPGDPNVPVELGRAQLDVGDFAAADAAFAAAEGSASARRAELGRLEVSLRIDPGSDLEAAQRTLDALSESFERDGDSAGSAEALAARAYVQLSRGRAAELDETLGAALRHARASGDHRAETSLLFLHCSVCWYGPLPVDEGLARCEGVLADARQRPNVEAAALQAFAVLQALNGEFDRARELVGSSRAISRDLGQFVSVAATAIDEGIVELLAGDFAAAERVLREGYAALELLGEKGYFSTLATLMAESVAAQGRIAEARELARAAAAAATADDVVSQVGWRATEARALAAEGASAEAERVAREATALAEATDFSLLRAQAWTALADVLGERGAEARRTAVGLLEAKRCAPAAVAVWTRSGA